MFSHCTAVFTFQWVKPVHTDHCTVVTKTQHKDYILHLIITIHSHMGPYSPKCDRFVDLDVYSKNSVPPFIIHYELHEIATFYSSISLSEYILNTHFKDWLSGCTVNLRFRNMGCSTYEKHALLESDMIMLN